MLDPAVLPGFVAAVVLVTVAPGPDNAFIAAVALDRGVRAGLLSAVGMALGMVVHVAATALGLALVLQSAPAALDVVRLLGATYLAWLAFTTLRSAGSRPTTAHRPPPDRNLLGRAVLTNVTNPKVILFFAAFLPQFVRTGHGPAGLQLATLGLIFLLVGLAVDAGVGVGAGKLGEVLAPDGRAATATTRLAGLTFAALATLLLVDAVR